MRHCFNYGFEENPVRPYIQRHCVFEGSCKISDTSKYHVEHLRDDRRSRAFQVVKDGALEGPAIGDDDENDRPFGTLKSSRSKKKKKGKIGI